MKLIGALVFAWFFAFVVSGPNDVAAVVDGDVFAPHESSADAAMPMILDPHVSGYVYNESGAPLSGVSVSVLFEVFRGPVSVQSVATDTNGFYKAAPAGVTGSTVYVVTVSAAKQGYWFPAKRTFIVSSDELLAGYTNVSLRGVSDAMASACKDGTGTTCNVAGIENRKEANLIFVTHGWCGWDAPPSGCEGLSVLGGMGGAIARKLGGDAWGGDASAWNWEIVEYDWGRFAGGWTDTLCVEWPRERAMRLGDYVGSWLYALGFQNLHLIGHSAGTWLIDGISDRVSLSAVNPWIHLTFLDAFLGCAPSSGELADFGDTADFAEQFVNKDGGVLFSTDHSDLPNVIHYDVTALKPGNVDGHGWPVKFYRDSVDPCSWSNSCSIPLIWYYSPSEYGFDRSYEERGTRPSHAASECGPGGVALACDRGRFMALPSDISSGVAVNGLDVPQSGWRFFLIMVPANSTKLEVVMSGGSGDMDLYTAYEQSPTLSAYSCRPWVNGNNETCTHSNPAAGTWWVGMYGYSAASGVTIKATVTSSTPPPSPTPTATPPPGGDTQLTSGVAVTGQSVAAGAWKYYYITVASGATKLDVVMSGGMGDADLYVLQGSKPTTSTYNCRPYLGGNAETCTINSPGSGTWWVGIYGYSAASGVTIKATVTGTAAPTPSPSPPGGDTQLTSGVAVTGQSVAAGAWKYYYITAATGTIVKVEISGGTGDADLYTRLGAKPTTTEYVCRPYLNGNTETCSSETIAGGTWWVGIYGYSAASGVTIKATIQ